MTTRPTTDTGRARRASQLLAEIDAEGTAHRLARELSADCANLANELDDEQPEDSGESYTTEL